jgi:hypothetical protein
MNEWMQTPTDISFAYSGYAPLSIRLLNHALSRHDGWTGYSEQLNKVAGKYSVTTHGVIDGRKGV